MSLKVPKKLTPILLGTLAIAIWGHNSYRFVTGVSVEENTIASTDHFNANSRWDKVDSSESEAGWIFKPQYRDPFQNWLVPHNRSDKTATKSKIQRATHKGARQRAAAVQPPIKLVGIIQDERGTLAVVEDNENMTWFASPGDTVSQSQITAVEATRIRYRYNGEEFTLSLE